MTVRVRATTQLPVAAATLIRKALLAAIQEGCMSFTSTALQTSEYTASAWDLIPYDTSGGTFPVNLPDATEADGKSIMFLNLGADDVELTILAAGSDRITTNDYTSIALRTKPGALYMLTASRTGGTPRWHVSGLPENDVTDEKDDDYTAKLGEFVRVDNDTRAVDITLPSAVGAGGQYVAVKHNRPGGTNVVRVVGTVDGVANFELAPLETLVAKSDNTNWMRVS